MERGGVSLGGVFECLGGGGGGGRVLCALEGVGVPRTPGYPPDTCVPTPPQVLRRLPEPVPGGDAAQSAAVPLAVPRVPR